MIENAFYILVLLQVKHWYIDFVNQSSEEVAHKGIYFNWLGVKHSVKQGIGTIACLLPFVYYSEVAVVLGFIDFIFHYHIDYCKMHFGNRDIKTPAFWAQLGLDQMAHQLTYLGIVYALYGL
jgi:hypothetical protein